MEVGLGHVTNSFRAAMDASGDIRVVWVGLELKSIYEGWRHPAFTREIPSGGEPGEATRLTGQTSGVSLAQRRDGTGYVGWVTPRVGALPRIVSVSGDGSLGEPTKSPQLFEAAAQIGRRFLVAYGRWAPDSGEAIWVRAGP